eukprot:scaffold8991_cov155-Skeletonema_dohrnii-CCMP3373.AAC.32
MGKKSKKSSGKGKGKDKDKGALRRENELPLYRKEQPEVFKTLVDEVNPVLRFNAGQTWICFDDDCFASPTINEKGELVAKRLTIREHGSAAECPICFKPASLKCRKCQSVFYCGEDCQKKHWKKSHKKACVEKPHHMYHFDINIDQFLSLPDEAFEGHEFLVIKPTEKLSSLDEICRDCLEPADDVFEKIPGFGCHQIEKHWLMNNNSDPICKKIQQHFGWTSGLHDISPLEGYIVSESQYVFFLMHDDNFIGRTDMATSFYGDACFPWAREGKHVRGNLVIFKLMIKNKKRVARNYPAAASLICIETDDDDLQFEYELCPTTKAEVGHMLQERRKAIEQGKYTRRQWRQKVRGKERAVEAEAIHKLSPSAMLLSM